MMALSRIPQRDDDDASATSYSDTCHDTPATPAELSPTAPITPDTKVPCPTLHTSLSRPTRPLWSFTAPDDTSTCATRFGTSSGCEPSTPVSSTATRTADEPVVWSHAAGVSATVCDHCDE